MNAIHGYSGRAHVSVAKHGAWGLTKALAKEFGPQGVTVNIVSPGPVQTGYISPEFETELAKDIPLRRVGQPKDIADVVTFAAKVDSVSVVVLPVRVIVYTDASVTSTRATSSVPVYLTVSPSSSSVDNRVTRVTSG